MPSSVLRPPASEDPADALTSAVPPRNVSRRKVCTKLRALSGVQRAPRPVPTPRAASPVGRVPARPRPSRGAGSQDDGATGGRPAPMSIRGLGKPAHLLGSSAPRGRGRRSKMTGASPARRRTLPATPTRVLPSNPPAGRHRPQGWATAKGSAGPHFNLCFCKFRSCTLRVMWCPGTSLRCVGGGAISLGREVGSLQRSGPRPRRNLHFCKEQTLFPIKSHARSWDLTWVCGQGGWCQGRTFHLPST